MLTWKWLHGDIQCRKCNLAMFESGRIRWIKQTVVLAWKVNNKKQTKWEFTQDVCRNHEEIQKSVV